MTPREAEVLVLLREALRNAQIVAALHVSVETVRTHARSIYRKLRISSRRELLALAARLRPMEPSVVAPRTASNDGNLS